MNYVEAIHLHVYVLGRPSMKATLNMYARIGTNVLVTYMRGSV